MSRTNQSIVETTEREDSFYLFFILLASPKKKETNKQKERWQGHRKSCGQSQRARILVKEKKIKKTRNIKKHS